MPAPLLIRSAPPPYFHPLFLFNFSESPPTEEVIRIYSPSLKKWGIQTM